jgi:PTH1 family peptidyl-tRNA hydrolase
MKLLVGLGNPGSQYQGNRHNIGFMALDAIARQHGIAGFRSKHAGSLAEGTIDGEKVILLKPQTFMNRSGDSVQQVAKFYKIDPADVIVLYDELDLAPGKVRVKVGGGNGGHNGLRSIDPQIGLGYRRVRLGVGHHVLGDFAKADQAWLDPLLDAIGKHAGLLLKDDDSGFMNKLALALKPETETAAKPSASGAAKAPATGQSHIRQARPAKPQAAVPASGPMADILKKLFKGD